MMITFMVKDCNKCNKRQRRLSSNIHSGNIAIGTDALRKYTGSYGVAIGYAVALDLVSGTNNTFVGQQA